MQDSWITTSEFTKSMEEILDLITESKATYLDFIKPLHARMHHVVPQKRKIAKPTEKQLDFAKKIAEAKGIKISKEVEKSLSPCSDFIEKHKNKGGKA